MCEANRGCAAVLEGSRDGPCPFLVKYGLDGTQLKMQVNDELLLAVDKLFGMKVVELG